MPKHTKIRKEIKLRAIQKLLESEREAKNGLLLTGNIDTLVQNILKK